MEYLICERVRQTAVMHHFATCTGGLKLKLINLAVDFELLRPHNVWSFIFRQMIWPQKLPDFFAALYVRYGPPDVSRGGFIDIW